MWRRGSRQREEPILSKDKEQFDPDAKHIKHTRVGVWDLYEEKRNEAAILLSSTFFQRLDEVLTSIPFVLRAFKEMMVISSGSLIMYLAASLVASLLPATKLYYSGQLLQVVQISLDSRTVDKTILIRALGCRMAVAVVEHIVNIAKSLASQKISRKNRVLFTEHIMRAHVRLDVPTFDDSAAHAQLRTANAYAPGNAVSWNAIKAIVAIISMMTQLISEFSVLVAVLSGQRDGFILALLSFAHPVLMWITRPTNWYGGVWAATCRNVDYQRMQGFKQLVEDKGYRGELVAGNLQEYVLSEFQKAQERVGDDNNLSLTDSLRAKHGHQNKMSVSSFLGNPLQEIPQVVFTLRAVQFPRSIPVSLASLTLIRQTVSSFSSQLEMLLYRTSSISETFASMRKFYEIVNIENKIVDGTEPYPEDRQKVKTGIALEFRDVSFKYPNSDKYAIRNVSFNVQAGQLCVLVGFNGSGKSTILKLLTRLYDPTEGVILVDGRDIKTLKLADLRRSISVLFQEYTHFPLSVKENIGMGNPEHATDYDMIRQAADLGGATEIIEELPEGFDTFLSRPVVDYYCGIPEGTQTLFGRKVKYAQVKSVIGRTENISLSGGQMQRLAVSRTFMRSLGDDSLIGLLLFDEPSASLDPAAEHDLFEHLRQLRGNKTMVFSTHRFGQLTRHADKILYMANSTVMELGTHDELLKLGGGYAKMYNIQASQFK